MEMGAIEIWTIIGVALLILEILAVSFFSMFFGLGALSVALLTYLNITPDLFSQVIAFVIVSVVSLLLFRKQLLESFSRKTESFKEIIDERAKVSVAIPAAGVGKVFYRGAEWMAESLNKTDIPEGMQVMIRKIDGIKLLVETE